MFTGIVERTGEVVSIKRDKENIEFTVKTEIAKEAYIDQSIAHNGVCLTVVSMKADTYKVVAVKETLMKTNLGDLNEGDFVNLERSMVTNQRLDGHFVQGHVDTTIRCTGIESEEGSWRFTFELPEESKHLIVPKGSVSLNGTSLTVILDDPKSGLFSIAVIPYTYEHTTFKNMKVGDRVNVEFDIFGKYVARYFEALKEK
jgi:riboflavin synthase